MFLQEQEQTQALEYFTQLANLLRSQGVPEEEIYRAIQSQIESPDTLALDWPGPITGIDLGAHYRRGGVMNFRWLNQQVWRASLDDGLRNKAGVNDVL